MCVVYLVDYRGGVVLALDDILSCPDSEVRVSLHPLHLVRSISGKQGKKESDTRWKVMKMLESKI